MFGIGTTELLIVLAIVVILFGASRIPQLGEGLGKGIRNFRRAFKGEDEINVTPQKKEIHEKSGTDQKNS